MVDTVLVLNQQSAVADTIETFYTSPLTGSGTIIKAFTASNDSGINRSYKAYIFDSTGSVVNAIVPFKIIIRQRFDLASSAVNQVIPVGGTLRMESSLANSILFYVTGNEQ